MKHQDQRSSTCGSHDRYEGSYVEDKYGNLGFASCVESRLKLKLAGLNVWGKSGGVRFVVLRTSRILLKSDQISFHSQTTFWRNACLIDRHLAYSAGICTPVGCGKATILAVVLYGCSCYTSASKVVIAAFKFTRS
jgi:hypothetical protein